MAQIKVNNLQYPMVFNVQIDHEDIGNELVIDVPPNFILLDAALSVRVVFDGTTPTLSIVDNKSSPVTIIASTSLAAVADTEATTARFEEYPSGGKIRILPVIAGGTNTVGRADVIVTGIVRGRQNERFGTNNAT